MQGFPALRKAVTTHVKYDIFHMCMISPIGCLHVTRLSRHPVRLMNEWQTLHYFQSRVVCRNLFALWLLKHWKIPIAYRQWRSNLPRRKRNQNMKRKNWKLHIQCLAFLAAENENWQLDDLPKANFGRVPERFLLSVRTNSNHWRILYIEN